MSWKRYEVDAVSLRVKGKTRRDETRWRGSGDVRTGRVFQREEWDAMMGECGVFFSE